jgi:hypothetical protein
MGFIYLKEITLMSTIPVTQEEEAREIIIKGKKYMIALEISFIKISKAISLL